MAGSINKVTLLGHLGADPEIKAFANGGKIANLRVATSESWKDKQSGERKERTEWTSVSVQSEGLVGVVEKYLRKGSKVYIEGSLRTRKWQDQAGADRYATEVVLSPFNGTIVLLDRKDDSGGGDHGASRGQSRGGYDQSPQGGGTVGQQARTGGGYGGGARSDIDDEIPFSPEWR